MADRLIITDGEPDGTIVTETIVEQPSVERADASVAPAASVSLTEDPIYKELRKVRTELARTNRRIARSTASAAQPPSQPADATPVVQPTQKQAEHRTSFDRLLRRWR